MAIQQIVLTDFRNIAKAELKPVNPGFNLLFGYNGSGKTSILEAIYYLGMGRSFRSTLIKRIIRHEAERVVLFSRLSLPTQTTQLGIERLNTGEMTIKLAGQLVRTTAELAELLPIQLINAHCYNLIEGAPHFRRKYIDWGVFYTHPSFFSEWRDLSKILKQRNALLRRSASKFDLAVWNDELVKKAQAVDQMRKRYLQDLLPLLQQALAKLLPTYANHPDLKINYYPGWDRSLTYQDVLRDSQEKDLQAGYTNYGPHRADLKITLDKVPVKDILSRGQQKLFVCAMILAQGGLLAHYTSKKPIYLIDDLPAELDASSRSNLITLLAAQKTQVFVTAVEPETLTQLAAGQQGEWKMFHVEHGKVEEFAKPSSA